MPLDKVLSSSIANGAVTAALISNTANLVVSSLTANVITITTISGSANVTGDMTVGGNLTISGTTTYVNTTDLNIGDAIISLNADLAANVAPTENAGLNINRGASTNAQFVWVESTDNWSLGNTTVSGILNANDMIITGTANVSTAINVGANVNLGTTYMDVGNSTVNTTITNITVSTNTVNVDSIINIGANVNLSTSQINVGNSTVNTVITSTSLTTTSNTVSVGTAAYVVANGNVGIGTASPGSKLDILRSSTTTAVFDESLIRAINTGAATLNQRVDIGMRFQDGTYNGTGGISMIRESATARSGGLSFSSIGSDGNPTNAMRLDSSGRLGLGVTPNTTWGNGWNAQQIAGLSVAASGVGTYQSLVIAGNAVMTGTTAANTAANYVYNDFATMYRQTTGQHQWWNAGAGTAGNAITFTQAMTLDASGNVGIGTSSPATKLHVNNTTGGLQVRATSDSDVSFRALATSADSAAFFQMSNDARDWTLRVNGAESDQFQIRDSTAGVTRVVIDSSGNLGIGTSSPNQKLELRTDTTTAGSEPNILLQNKGSSNTTPHSIGGIYGSAFRDVRDPGYVAGINFYRDSVTSGLNSAGNILFYTLGDAGTLAELKASERMRLNSSGNLGVGTTGQVSRISASGNSATDFKALTLRNFNGTANSAAVLNFEVSAGTEGDAASSAAQIKGVREGAGTNGALAFWTSLSGTSVERARIDSNGNLGIGTVTPNAKLSIIDEDGGQAMIQMRNFNTSATGAFLGTYATELRSASTGATVHGVRIHLNESNDDRRTLDVADSNGIIATFVNSKVGIGTTSPAVRLQVNGGTRAGSNTVYTDWNSDSGGTYFENTGTSSGTRAIRLQAHDGGSVNYAQVIISGGSQTVTFATNSTTRLTISSGGDVYTASRNLFSSMGQAFSIVAGGTLVVNIESVGGLYTSGLLYVLGRENGLNQTIAVYSFNLSYHSPSGNRYIRLMQISRNTVNNDYGNVYAYLSTYAASWTSTDQSHSGTSTAVSDIYFRNAVGQACTGNYLLRFTGS